jgi:hypothetical protein
MKKVLNSSNKTQIMKSDLNLSPIVYMNSLRGLVPVNVYKNLEEIRTYLSIPCVFRTTSLPNED